MVLLALLGLGGIGLFYAFNTITTYNQDLEIIETEVPWQVCPKCRSKNIKRIKFKENGKIIGIKV